jgi:hypothetical protein
MIRLLLGIFDALIVLPLFIVGVFLVAALPPLGILYFFGIGIVCYKAFKKGWNNSDRP